jgi:hypothetical protein
VDAGGRRGRMGGWRPAAARPEVGRRPPTAWEAAALCVDFGSPLPSQEGVQPRGVTRVPQSRAPLQGRRRVGAPTPAPPPRSHPFTGRGCSCLFPLPPPPHPTLSPHSSEASSVCPVWGSKWSLWTQLLFGPARGGKAEKAATVPSLVVYCTKDLLCSPFPLHSTS